MNNKRIKIKGTIRRVVHMPLPWNHFFFFPFPFFPFPPPFLPPLDDLSVLRGGSPSAARWAFSSAIRLHWWETIQGQQCLTLHRKLQDSKFHMASVTLTRKLKIAHFSQKSHFTRIIPLLLFFLHKFSMCNYIAPNVITLSAPSVPCVKASQWGSIVPVGATQPTTLLLHYRHFSED